MGPEAKIEAKVRDYCQSKGWRLLKLAGPAGWPDRTLIADEGVTIFIEFKTPKGRLSSAQEWWQVTLTEQGHAYYVARDFENTRRFIDEQVNAARTRRRKP